MANTRRVEKFAALIRREISQLMLEAMKDDSIKQSLLTITDVNVSNDLQYCKIFISLLGEKSFKEEILQQLQSSSRFFKGELARRLKMRRAPEIVFKLDQGIEKGSSVLHLLGKLDNERKTKQNINKIS